MQSLVEALRDPHARHAMLVHLPIVLGVTGVVPLAILAMGRFRCDRLRWTVVAWFALLSLSSLVAASSGSAAARNLERSIPPLSPGDQRALAMHEHRGERAWIWPLIPALLVAWTARPAARPVAGRAAAVAAVGVACWFGLIGHVGGRLVYARGLGVPVREVVAVEAGPGRTEPDMAARGETDP